MEPISGPTNHKLHQNSWFMFRKGPDSPVAEQVTGEKLYQIYCISSQAEERFCDVN